MGYSGLKPIIRPNLMEIYSGGNKYRRGLKLLLIKITFCEYQCLHLFLTQFYCIRGKISYLFITVFIFDLGSFSPPYLQSPDGIWHLCPHLQKLVKDDFFLNAGKCHGILIQITLFSNRTVTC